MGCKIRESAWKKKNAKTFKRTCVRQTLKSSCVENEKIMASLQGIFGNKILTC